MVSLHCVCVCVCACACACDARLLTCAGQSPCPVHVPTLPVQSLEAAVHAGHTLHPTQHNTTQMPHTLVQHTVHVHTGACKVRPSKRAPCRLKYACMQCSAHACDSPTVHTSAVSASLVEMASVPPTSAARACMQDIHTHTHPT